MKSRELEKDGGEEEKEDDGEKDIEGGEEDGEKKREILMIVKMKWRDGMWNEDEEWIGKKEKGEKREENKEERSDEKGKKWEKGDENCKWVEKVMWYVGGIGKEENDNEDGKREKKEEEKWFKKKGRNKNGMWEENKRKEFIWIEKLEIFWMCVI